VKRLAGLIVGLGLLAGAGSPESAGWLGPLHTSPAAHRGTLVIHGAGDVWLDPTHVRALRHPGAALAWSGLEGLFRRDDVTIINLECPVSLLGSPVPKAFTFRCDPSALPAMRAAGVEVANLGNNHAYDYGPEALLDTRRNVAGAGIVPVGVGKDITEATRPALLHVEGWTVAVLGFDEVVDGVEWVAARAHPGTACGYDEECILTSIRGAAAVADLVVIDIHWGVDFDTRPREWQVQQAHRFIEAGADVIFGGHSHRLQPMEIYRGRPIFYSLGNLLWPRFSRAESRTAIAEVVVTPDGRIHGRLIPTYIASDGHPVLGSQGIGIPKRPLHNS
jgi:poly-gamma-glutamate synthesis protein (capsule biosynthesis protein)